mmetsp:Transcript_27632/g.40921  ORF Transcript_27632/g.40921 Transcript_27632/m.40921 type:complete len:218 (+) Transcript_27632:1514-2167(+)
MECIARLTCNRRIFCQELGHKSIDKRGECFLRNRPNVKFTNSSNGPCSGILDHIMLIRQRQQKNGNALVHIWSNRFRTRTFQNTTERHGSSFTEPPILTLDVLLYKRSNHGDNCILHCVRDKTETSRSSHTQIPNPIIRSIFLILLGQGIGQERSKPLQCPLDIIHTLPGNWNPIHLTMMCFINQINFFLADRTPELNPLKSNLFFITFNGSGGKSK